MYMLYVDIHGVFYGEGPRYPGTAGAARVAAAARPANFIGITWGYTGDTRGSHGICLSYRFISP